VGAFTAQSWTSYIPPPDSWPSESPPMPPPSEPPSEPPPSEPPPTAALLVVGAFGRAALAFLLHVGHLILPWLGLAPPMCPHV